MRIGELFAGIGGLGLGLETAQVGHVVWQVEQDEYASKVLAKHWPRAKRYTNVEDVGAHNLEPVDLLCGGFPCQDLSISNQKGQGLEGQRSGLWFEFERIANELRPEWIVIENVQHTWKRWVPVVRRRLHAIGYASVPLRLSAADVGAWHRRRRVFILAHADCEQLRQLSRRWTGAHGQMEKESIGPIRWTPRTEPPRVDDGVPHRVDRNRCLGNAVVPQCSYFIGNLIKQLNPTVKENQHVQ